MERTDLMHGKAKLFGTIRGQGSSPSGGGVEISCLGSRGGGRRVSFSHLAARQASAGKRHIDGHCRIADHEAGRTLSFCGCRSAGGSSADASRPCSTLAGPSEARGVQLELDQASCLI